MANDFFSTLRVYLSKISEGDKAPAEVLASLNTWLRDSGESIKVKIEEEVERTVKKMGFVKQADFERLKKEVETLKNSAPRSTEVKSRKVAKKVAKKSAVKATGKKGAATKPVSSTSKTFETDFFHTNKKHGNACRKFCKRLSHW